MIFLFSIKMTLNLEMGWGVGVRETDLVHPFSTQQDLESETSLEALAEPRSYSKLAECFFGIAFPI